VDPYSPDVVRDYEPIHPRGPDVRGFLRKLWGGIIVIGAAVLKFGIAFAKFASIFVAVGGYALIWGWKFAVGLVFLILVHEMGHYLEARRQGLHPALPVFIPFLGAYVSIKDERNPWQHAKIALAGPIVGGIGAAALWLVGEADSSRLLQALGYTGFLLNLFNLLPVGFLDGGHIARCWRYLRLGGARGRAFAVGFAYVATAALLVAGMYAAHVHQGRL
jgi:Zn-dependent protease